MTEMTRYVNLPKRVIEQLFPTTDTINTHERQDHPSTDSGFGEDPRLQRTVSSLVRTPVTIANTTGVMSLKSLAAGKIRKRHQNGAHKMPWPFISLCFLFSVFTVSLTHSKQTVSQKCTQKLFRRPQCCLFTPHTCGFQMQGKTCQIKTLEPIWLCGAPAQPQPTRITRSSSPLSLWENQEFSSLQTPMSLCQFLKGHLVSISWWFTLTFPASTNWFQKRNALFLQQCKLNTFHQQERRKMKFQMVFAVSEYHIATHNRLSTWEWGKLT